MKRSEINALMADAISFIDKMNFKLPPFAFFSPDDWAKKATNMMKSEIICWVGILPISARGILKKPGF